MKLKVIIMMSAFIALSISAICCGQDSVEKIETRILKFEDDLDLTSVVIAFVNEDGISWKDAYGKANIENNIDVTTEHLYMHGSVSKLFTMTALMKLYEEGKFKLDDDINSYLPFVVRNPDYADIPITFRMLLTHTSSIADRQDLQNELYFEGDPRMSLQNVCQKYFDPAGEYYTDKNYMDFAPGDRWDYCNWNYVLIGYLVEQISGMPYTEFSRKYVLEPLDMQSAGWLLSEVKRDQIATLYGVKKGGEKWPVVNFSWPGYPDGCLRSSIEETAHFLQMYLNDGEYNGRKVLEPETVKTILEPQHIRNPPKGYLTDMALAWHILEPLGSPYAHTGTPTGTHVAIFFDRELKKGFIAFVTGLRISSEEEGKRFEEFYAFLMNAARSFER